MSVVTTAVWKQAQHHVVPSQIDLHTNFFRDHPILLDNHEHNCGKFLQALIFFSWSRRGFEKSSVAAATRGKHNQNCQSLSGCYLKKIAGQVALRSWRFPL